MEEHLLLLQVEQETNITPLEEVLSLSQENGKWNKESSSKYQSPNLKGLSFETEIEIFTFAKKFCSCPMFEGLSKLSDIKYL